MNCSMTLPPSLSSFFIPKRRRSGQKLILAMQLLIAEMSMSQIDDMFEGTELCVYVVICYWYIYYCVILWISNIIYIDIIYIYTYIVIFT